MLNHIAPIACLASTVAGQVYPSDPTVQLDSKLTIRGFVAPESPSVNQFLGIPYAEPPIESRRWLPPQPYSKADGIIDATQMPPSCIQGDPFAEASVYSKDAPEFLIDGAGQSEDCLTLSVWAPNTEAPAEGFPVLIWIYGGGFVSGGTDVPYQNPVSWVQRSKDLIVVALSYRLNVFGFPSAPGLDEQNLAMLDQRLAVEWVQSNIAQFGGDPSRLTLWGQSAGAMSVDIYNFAWHDNPIVQGFIMDSGTAHVPLYNTPNNTYFTQLATLANCSSPDAAQTLDCLRALPARTIENLVNQAGLPFSAVPDERVVFANYTQRAAQGLLSPLPALIGTNRHEGASLVAYDPAGVNETAAAESTLSFFFCPALETSQERLDSGVEGASTYRYYYSGNFTNVSPRPWLGAYHSAELPLLFGTYDIVRGKGGRFEAKVSKTMQDSWRNFVRDGAKAFSNENWPEYEGIGGTYRFFVDGKKVKRNGQLQRLESKCG